MNYYNFYHFRLEDLFIMKVTYLSLVKHAFYFMSKLCGYVMFKPLFIYELINDLFTQSRSNIHFNNTFITTTHYYLYILWDALPLLFINHLYICPMKAAYCFSFIQYSTINLAKEPK